MIPCIMLNLVFEEPYSLPCKFFFPLTYIKSPCILFTLISIGTVAFYWMPIPPKQYPKWHACFWGNGYREFLHSLPIAFIFPGGHPASFSLGVITSLKLQPMIQLTSWMILKDPAPVQIPSSSLSRDATGQTPWNAGKFLDFPYPPGWAYHFPNSHSDCTKMKEKGYKDLTLSYHHNLLRFFTETSQVQTSNYMEIFGWARHVTKKQR